MAGVYSPQKKAGWGIESKRGFEGRLMDFGWRRLGVGVGKRYYHSLSDLSILVDDGGIFVFRGRERLYGLSDDYCDRCRSRLGPLCVNPFEKEKAYVWLDLATGKIEGEGVL